MSDYKAPVQDIMATIKYGVGFDRLQALKGQDELDENLLQAVLDEAAKFAGQILAPTNETGDREGAKRNPDGTITVPKGFTEAYKQFCDMGWNGLSFDTARGGQGLPWSVNFTVQEMWQSANMAFGLCPMLTQGAVEAITHHGDKAQQDLYLTKLVTGEWTGTMNLTEPQAGSDLAAVKTKAVKQPDGTYKISGQKIFITFGEHSMSDNIVHLVLARTPDAPEGVKGISMFIVPKFIPDANGAPAAKNDITCTSIEHKLGIHGSPTCTMQFGDKGGATGYLIGAENDGMKNMFTMMNNARLAVGLQGVAIAERAYQHALAYANDRTQGKSLSTGKDNAKIIDHPDVERMLVGMRSSILVGRLLSSHAVINMDEAKINGDKAAQDRVDILTPIVKSWCTDRGVAVASAGVQVWGGMGFIEESGAAQFYRDARILPIYEGTNGIQAADLTFRKVIRDGGAAMNSFILDIKTRLADVKAGGEFDAADLDVMTSGIKTVEDALSWVLASGKSGDMAGAAAASHAFLTLCGNVFGGVYLAQMATKAAADLNAEPDQDYTAMAKFFIHNDTSQAPGLLHTIRHNAASLKAAKPFKLRGPR